MKTRTVHNVRITEGTTLQVGVPGDYKAPEGACRVLRTMEDELIIGTVVGTEPEQNLIYMTFPMWIDTEDSDSDEIVAYEFHPYMRNIINFDISSPEPVVFNVSNILSVVHPSEHLSRNYYHTLLTWKAISDEGRGIKPPETKQ